MQASINSFSPTAELPMIFKTYTANQLPEHLRSITIRNSDVNVLNVLNEKILETLKSIELLKDNWDEDGAKTPLPESIQMAKGIIYFLSAIGQGIYNIAPGPKGEILIDLRNNTKSLEILIYTDMKMLFVQFDEKGQAIQDKFSPELLHTHLIAWLNS